tara:strand:- start:62055 stop:63023 length:969 start_codon:yes stop_codon:yes gene_type:complete
MKNTPNIKFTSAFEEDIYKGLTRNPKQLSSKYFYDKKGDKLFQDIMNMPEYYLTNCEYNIIKSNTEEIADAFEGPNGFDLIELGAGDGKKTKLLLKYLADKKVVFDYLPVDISQNALDDLEQSIKNELPTVRTKPQQGTYFKTLERLADYNSRKKVILVLGSNIGNLLHKDAIDFLKQIQVAMSPEDMLFMGFDQKKDPQIILDAYNDKAGITAAFNKNLLERINTELQGNFDLDSFSHWETYDPETGTAKSFLMSIKEQTVTIKDLELTVSFEAWESIHTEISQKYDDAVVEWLANQADLKVSTSFSDKENYYKNYIFRKK